MSSSLDNITQAKGLLFVPASRADRISKAFATGVDSVIVDLEDAVAPANKERARQDLLDWLNANTHNKVIVRINATNTLWYKNDLAICSHAGIAAIMLPKAESSIVINEIFDKIGKPIIPLIETVAGLDAVREIASSVGCVRLAFGKLDLAVELNLDTNESESDELIFLAYRAMLIMASYRANLVAPIEGVFTDINDLNALASYTKRAKQNGFGGQLLIHPKQVAVVRDVFHPKLSEIRWASSVLSTSKLNKGEVAVIDNKMVDAPVIAKAKRILQDANIS